MKLPEKLIGQIKSVLSANLLHPQWKRLAVKSQHPLSGHCYAASEALYHLWGKKNGFTPRRLEIIDNELGPISHWYLQHLSGTIVDITADQFAYKLYNTYQFGCMRGFLTSKPSRRAREIIRRVKTKL